MSDNIDIIVQDTINDIVVNSSTIVETIDIVVEASVEEITIISNPNDYIININRIIGEQVQSDWNETQPNDPSYIKNKPTIPDAQVNSDWNATTGVAQILNKPTIPTQVTNTSELINDGADGVHPFITAQDIPAGQVNSDWNATSGVAEILNKPTIPAEQVNSDWNATSGKAQILNKPTIPSISGLATVTYVDSQDALKVDKVSGKGLSTNDFTNTLKTKLDGIQDGAEVNVNADWNATSGDARILNKPTIPSIAGLATITYVDTQDALKVDKVTGKGLSTNDYTTAEKNKLAGIQAGAEVNVNADWNATSGDAQILNKPTIPSISGLATITYVDTQDALKVDKVTGYGLSQNDFTNTLKTKLDGIQDGAEVNVNADWNATSGDAQILNKPTIPAAQVNSDWNATSGVAQILNKPTIPAAVTNTSDLINDGADGVNPFITALDIPITGQASTIVREVKNMTGATLTKGSVVYISGANGNKILVSKAQASSESLSSRTFGLLQSNILNNGVGNCVVIGDVSGLDTSSFTEGAQLYLSPTTAGAYTTTKPSAPDHLVYIGKITRSHPTQGQIEVQIQNGYELQELHNVAINGVSNNQLLSYESSTSLWKNKSVTTADIADSTNKRYVTDANLTTIGNQSGTNTGDETTSTIKSKLGITTLSGSNTGDQDLSGLVPNTRTINTKALSSDVTLTTADIADSTNKRYVTDANLTTIGNQSGTNTGDNAVNSLYSGLATSKQDTLVSGTNIKTINGNSVLGSGNLVISGGTGLQGIHALIPLSSGNFISSQIQASSSASASAFTSNRLLAYPFIPNQSFTTSNLFINVQTLAASSLCRIAIYDDLNGYPNNRLFLSSDLDCSTTGNKTATTSFSFVSGVVYWLAFHGNAQATNAGIINFGVTQLLPIRNTSATAAANHIFVSSTFTLGTPINFPTASPSYSAGNIPAIIITKA
jgi:major membrane immunogen (membrane-anchored lipoprotein)